MFRIDVCVRANVRSFVYERETEIKIERGWTRDRESKIERESDRE